MNTIPASQLVQVLPSVLQAGGNPLSLNAVFLTHDASVPIGTVKAFSTLADVNAWFGAESTEAILAAVYFAGFENASRLPGTLYFAQYNAGAVAGYMRGGSLAGLSLSDLQALSGTLVIPVDGAPVHSANINLAGATSFTNAAALIQAGLQVVGGIFDGVGTIDNGAGSAGTVLTITAVTTGALHVGDTLSGVGVTANTKVLAQVSGTSGGIGVYTVDTAQDDNPAGGAIHVTSTATVVYDSLRDAFRVVSPTTGANSAVGVATGSLAAGVHFTTATGAVTSAGAAAATPGGVLASVLLVTQNWATFMTTWEPDLAGKLAFATWVQGQNNRFAYVAWDSDITATQGDAPDSFGATVKALEMNGVFVVWNTDGKKAAFVCGITASINFAQRDGRITYAFKAQAGLAADVTDATVSDNLKANGYNFYGAFGTANDQFVNLQNGAVAGSWKWFDAYINQIWLNNEFQLAYMVFLQNALSVPYNQDGYNKLRAVAVDVANAALLFGAIRIGVPLSASQRAQVNTAAGADIATVLQTAGFYMQVLPATPEQRANRASPPMTFLYMDGGSIQQVRLASVNIQ